MNEAEILKRRYGFVALGGAYEEPESEVAATISKIIRNVMTRLHGEINRTINIYRAQQKGSKPTKLLLAGGSSTMDYTVHFFSEKLRIEVDYFNAFTIVEVKGDREDLSKMAHLFPETIGTALRKTHPCPVDIDLTPKAQQAGKKISGIIPYVLASAVIWLSILVFFWLVKVSETKLIEQTIDEGKADTKIATGQYTSIDSMLRKTEEFKDDYLKIKDLLDSRYVWSAFFNAIQDAKPVDIWICSIKRYNPDDNRVEDVSLTEEAVATEDMEVTDFVLECYEVQLNEVYDNPPRYVRPIFTKEQNDRFKAVQQSRKTLMESEGYVPPEGEFPDPVDPKFANEQFVKKDTLLFNVFLESLRYSDYFSADPEETKIVVQPLASDKIRNLRTFQIVVKLKKPIKIGR